MTVLAGPNVPKPFVFILMPFREEFNDLYHLGIKQACLDAGAYCERVDEQNFDGSIVERIYNQIAKADVVIADMTGRSPNVFYEAGYAHALGKRTILLTQSAEDIPFDLMHYTHIVYGKSIVYLKTELVPRVRWAVENPHKALVDPISFLAFHLAGREIQNGVHFSLPFSSRPGGNTLAHAHSVPLSTRIKIDIQNRSSRPFDASRVQAGLAVPATLANAIDGHNVIQLPGGGSIVMFDTLKPFLPHSWQSLSVTVPNKALQNIADQRREFALQVFTEMGTREVSFTVDFADNSTATRLPPV